jgi:hypothetical protein
VSDHPPPSRASLLAALAEKKGLSVEEALNAAGFADSDDDGDEKGDQDGTGDSALAAPAADKCPPGAPSLSPHSAKALPASVLMPALADDTAGDGGAPANVDDVVHAGLAVSSAALAQAAGSAAAGLGGAAAAGGRAAVARGNTRERRPSETLPGAAGAAGAASSSSSGRRGGGNGRAKQAVSLSAEALGALNDLRLVRDLLLRRVPSSAPSAAGSLAWSCPPLPVPPQPLPGVAAAAAAAEAPPPLPALALAVAAAAAKKAVVPGLLDQAYAQVTYQYGHKSHHLGRTRVLLAHCLPPLSHTHCSRGFPRR